MMLRFHTQTAGSSLTAQQPMNNVTRTTIQALAAVLGGTQSLHTNSFDEALGLPTEESATIALRTQQLIAHESGAADTIDPLAGSYFVEQLTDEIESKAMAYISQIDEMGGAIEAVKNSYFQDEIGRSAYDYQRAIEAEEKIIVGVNRFVAEQEEQPPILRIDASIAEKQVARLQKLRAERDNDAVSSARERLVEAAKGTDNLMPFILNAVEKYVTLGEISDSLRSVFGEHQ